MKRRVQKLLRRLVRERDRAQRRDETRALHAYADEQWAKYERDLQADLDIDHEAWQFARPDE